MKIEQLIVQHLYNAKQVSLQQIGTFYLSHDANVSGDTPLPDNAITFEYNTRAPEDEALIDYIIQQTRKIRPLASSDLESYCILGREYLNIGKPFYIGGLGTLQKSQNGGYEFIQGHSVNPKLEAGNNILREKEDDDISFSTVNPKPAKSYGMLVFVAILFLALTAAAIYYLVTLKNKQKLVEEVPVTDTLVQQAPPVAVIDSTPPRKIPGDTSSFKVVVKQYSSEAAAQKAFDRFTSYGHKLYLHKEDSTRWTLSIPFYNVVSDTVRAKDSLQRLFGNPVYVDMD